MAGTDDNILGGQDAVIRVGVEADMGDILEQATKFNELIKDANDSFNVMQTVIMNTTNRMASLQSATLRLVSSARQLRNEYELIADSTQRISPMGMGAYGGYGMMAPAVAGIGGGNLAAMAAGPGVPGWAASSFSSPSMTSSGLIIPGSAALSTFAGRGGGMRMGGGQEATASLSRAGQESLGSASSALGKYFNLWGGVDFGRTLNKYGELPSSAEILYRSWGRPSYAIAGFIGRALAKRGKFVNNQAYMDYQNEKSQAQNAAYARQVAEQERHQELIDAVRGGGSISREDLPTVNVPGLGNGVLLGGEQSGAAAAEGLAAEAGLATEVAGAAGAVEGMGALGRAATAAAGIGGAAQMSTALAALPVAIPVIGAIIGTVAAAYKAADYLVKGATRYSGMTGGTGVFSGIEGDGIIDKGSFFNLQKEAWLSGLFNMAVGPGGYTSIQEGMMKAGIKPISEQGANALGTQGLRWDTTRKALGYLYAAGFQDVGQNVEAMKMSIQDMGGATAAFIGGMDTLRYTAQRTGVELDTLAKVFSKSLRNMTNMGAQGNWATFYSTSASTAYANARNTILKEGGGVADLSTMGATIQLINTPAFQSMGIGLNNIYSAYTNTPNMAGTLAAGQDQSVDSLLSAVGLGGLKGRSYEEVDKIVRNNSVMVMALRQSPMIANLVGPDVINNTDAFIDWIVMNAKGDPNVENIQDLKEKYGANPIRDFTNASDWLSSDRGPGKRDSMARDRIKDMLKGGITDEDMAKYPVLATYANYINRTGQNIGWMNSLLSGDSAKNAYVNYNNQIMKMGKFMTQYGNDPEAIRLMESGQLQVAISKDGSQPLMSDFSEAYNLGNLEGSLKDATLSDLENSISNGLASWVKDKNNNAGDNKLKVGISFDGFPGV